jgi:hypothetical protein
MLQLTSCLFSTIVVHAYYLKSTAYHHVFLAVTVLVAHFAYLLVLTDTRLAIQRAKPWLLGFPMWAAVFWFAQSFIPARKMQLHALLHLTAVIGMHVYLRELHTS